ncbi:MAG: exo-alpha-sialidase [Clostridiales bacterium]|nr:exo-alpha-sialidase [Clostridiales bacterium]
MSKTSIDYDISLSTIYSNITDEYCWVHTRGGAIPGNPPLIVATTQQWAMGQSDIFSEIYHLKTEDMGATWTEPIKNENLGRMKTAEGLEMAISDQYPVYHKATGKLLSTGHTLTYDGGVHPASSLNKNLRIFPAYTIYNSETDSWSDWKTIDLGDDKKFHRSSAGCSQRYDLEDGTFLLPNSYSEEGSKYTKMTVIKCNFDGENINVIDVGNELAVNTERGLAEGSVTKFNGTYYLTIRHNLNGYVCTSKDGLNFTEPITWKWDTGIDVKTYNTQSHWVTHSDGLFLTYTRNAGNNSHVFRHRAPLFIAEVDTENLCLLRHTEKVLMPERGARLGNFSTVNVDKNETWVFNTEVISPPECIKYGCDGSIFVAKIKWYKPNRII